MGTMIEKTESKEPKLHSLLIDKVNNGFILYENERSRDTRNPEYFHCSMPEKLVFNTKDQLKQFIDEKF